MTVITINKTAYTFEFIGWVTRQLGRYIAGDFDHEFGVCRWIAKQLPAPVRQCDVERVFDFVSNARNSFSRLSPWGAHSYVDREYGRTPRRTAFAKTLHHELETMLKNHHRSPDGTPLTVASPEFQRQLAERDKEAQRIFAPASCVAVEPPPPAPTVGALKAGTQAYRVLQALLAGNTKLSAIAAVARCGETAASARIRELRTKWGWKINVEQVRYRDDYGTSKTRVTYTIGAQ